MHPRSLLARLPGDSFAIAFSAIFLAQTLSGCAPVVQLSRPIPAKEDDGVRAVEHVVRDIGFDYKLGPITGFLRANQGFTDSTIQFESVDAWVESPKRSGPFASGIMGVLTVERRMDSGSNLEIAVVSRRGDADAYANLFHSAVQQQLEIDAGRRKPYVNPRKSPVGFGIRNTVLPVWGFHYAEADNPLLGSTIRGWRYGYYGLMDAYGATMLGLSLSSSDASDRKKYLGEAISVFVISRAFGYLGLIGISDYNRIATSPYNLAEIDF